MLADRMDLKGTQINRILDVGIGTGHPMKQIIDRIPKDTQVVGIDIDKNYLRFLMIKNLKKNKNIKIC